MGSVGTASTDSRSKGMSVAIVIVNHSLQSRRKESKRTHCIDLPFSPRVCCSPHIAEESPMQFDPALAAQQAFSRADTNNELGTDWDDAVEAEVTFSSNAGATARAAYEQLLALATRYPKAHSFKPFCIYITWQQVTEETIAHHFQTGMRLCEAFLVSREAKDAQDIAYVTAL